MKNLIRLAVCVLFAGSMVFAQTAKIETLPISPRLLSSPIVGTIAPGSNPVYSGNHNVAKGMPVYLTADTATGVTSFTWTLEGPNGTSSTLNSTTDQQVKFTPDMVGNYTVYLEVNGGDKDTAKFVCATYKGTDLNTDCEFCHASDFRKFDTWKQSPHANMFKNGITGQVEVAPVNGQMMGVYSVSRCAKCHTTGYDQNADNGNFGYLAKQNHFSDDTVWAKTFTSSNGEFLIPQGDQTAWDLLNNDSRYNDAATTADIGCESCHGPASMHTNSGNPANITATLNAGVCLQCHDAPTHHTIGTYYVTSVHAKLPDGEHTARTSCFPCHSGGAYVKYVKNQDNPGWTNADGDIPISCAVCHDPHDGNNLGLRISQNITLENGFAVTAGGRGQICMRCHQARKDGSTAVNDNASALWGFSRYYGPHHGPQTDMLFGENAYQYGDTTITGLMTHGAVVSDACVTCHMADIGSGHSASHQWGMVDTTGGTPHDLVGGCVNCHGNITSFDDIKAPADWDGNGKIEGVQTEVHGMMDELASFLPKDGNGEVITNLNTAADSAKITSKAIVAGIYTYEFVYNDRSYGVHNAPYTVAILQKALADLGYTVPIEMTSFTAEVNSNKVSLSWSTATETNNKGFVVERKTNGDWEQIGYVNGKGNSTEMTNYSFVDNLKGVSANEATYRLKQVDFNGTSKYSKEVNVAIKAGPKEYTLSQNYPNPFNPSTTIKYALPFASNVKLTVYNITGEVVKVLVNGTQESGSHEVMFNTSNGVQLSSGIYFYSLQATSKDGMNTFNQTKKMILLK